MNSNFLDDILYRTVITYKIIEPKDFENLLNKLYQLTEDKFKPQLWEGMSRYDVKVIIDRVFNAWESALKKLKAEKWFLVDMLDKYKYQNIFMQNEELKRIYYSVQ